MNSKMKAKYSKDKLNRLGEIKQKAEFINATNQAERLSMVFGILIEVLDTLERIEAVLKEAHK